MCSMPLLILSESISGYVKDSRNVPLHYATVVLSSGNDSTYIEGTSTDSLGYFVFRNSEMTTDVQYILQFSSIGYITAYGLAVANQTIILEDDVQLLDEIVVKGERPISRITSEGQQTTIAHTILSEMGTGKDVLKQIPM